MKKGYNKERNIIIKSSAKFKTLENIYSIAFISDGYSMEVKIYSQEVIK
mgnify:CR=1 FL=1